MVGTQPSLTFGRGGRLPPWNRPPTVPMTTRPLRALVALALLAGCSSAVVRPSGVTTITPAPATPTPIVVVEPTEPREQTADQQVQQVLNRLAFGARNRLLRLYTLASSFFPSSSGVRFSGPRMAMSSMNSLMTF
jgi:hypothetical protein